MDQDKIFEVFVNPLAFLEVDEPWASAMPVSEIDISALLRVLCTPGLPQDIDSLVGRYKEISVEPKRVNVAPNEENILNKLVWPLRHAKMSYVLGNFVGTIALSGMVGEMVAILLFECADLQINGRPLDEDLQRALLGSTFERLGQDRRIAVLHANNAIDGETMACLTSIKEIRRRYLHFYSQDYSGLRTDAVEAFQAAVKSVVNLMGLGVDDHGRLLMRPKFIAYLKRLGVINRHEA